MRNEIFKEEKARLIPALWILKILFIYLRTYLYINMV